MVFRSLTTAALLALLCTGCLGNRFVLDAANLYSPESIITNKYQPCDVPTPRNFDYLPKESFSYVGSFRVVDLDYTGEELVEKVMAFYDDQMPKHGWSYLRREGVYAITTVYVNARNECRVTLRRLGHRTHCRIRVLPRDVKPYGL